MPILTFVECEKPCGDRLEVADKPTPEQIQAQSEIYSVTDPYGEKFYFTSVACFKAWAAKYESPYIKRGPKGVIDDILPGLEN